MKLKLFLILYFLTYAIELRSHELWLEAEDFRLNKGSKLIANIKVGENLIGESYPFLKKETEKLFIQSKSMEITQLYNKILTEQASNIYTINQIKNSLNMMILIHF